MSDRDEARAHTEATLDPRRPLPAGEAALGAGRFGAVYEIGRQLLEQTDPATVLRTIHDAIVEHLRPDRACVLTLVRRGLPRPSSATTCPPTARRKSGR